MSWLFSRALGEAYLAGNCSDGEPSAPSKPTPTPQAFLWRGKTTDTWTRFPSGMTCELLMASRGEELLTWCLAGSPAQTSVLPEKGRASRAKSQGCGEKWQGSFARYDRDSRLWRTRQRSLLGGLVEFSETWPKWGSMLDGVVWPQKTPSLLEAIRSQVTKEKGCGFLPTPTTDGWRSDGDIRILARLFSQQEVRAICHRAAASKIKSAFLPTPTANMGERGGRGDILGLARGYHYPSGRQDAYRLTPQLIVGGPKEQLNPFFLEWQMGWPIGWTALEPLEMGKFQRWLRLHGRS